MNHVSHPGQPSEELQRRFGRNFREARMRAGLSQQAAAELTGSTQAYVSLVELGQKNMTLQSIAQFAAGIGCSAEALLGADRRISTLGDLEQIVSAVHDELRSLSKENMNGPVTLGTFCHILRVVASRIEGNAD